MLQWIKKYKSLILKVAFPIGIFLGAAFLLCVPIMVGAQSVADANSTLQEGVNIIEEPLGLPADDIRLIIARVIKVALGLIGVVLVVFMIYAGYLWMTAGGNDEQIAKAKMMLKNLVIGLAIILSAYSIVWFVFKMLGVADGERGTTGVSPTETQNFHGSGALGQIIKDHYPTRGQEDVPRNVKIIITFRKPISLQNLIEDRSGNNSQPDGILGNCNDNFVDWRTSCDRVLTNAEGLLSDDLINLRKITDNVAVPALAISAITSTVDNITGVYTIVLRPLVDLDAVNGGYLGSPSEEIAYTVRLGKELRLDAEGNPRVFETTRIGHDYYEWQFQCSTAVDTVPPFVANVYPDRNATEPKNSVIQVDFSEAIDPSGIQGVFVSAGDQSYYVAGEHLFLKVGDQTSRPVGSFNLTNGYRTLEFTPEIPCGTNACGGTVYCLPVCDRPGASCNQTDYEILLRAAHTLGADTFEAQPFSGIMDISGNALDGNKNRTVQHANNTGSVFPNWQQPDNDYWKFTINNNIDLSSPYLTYVYPGLDAQYVEANEPWLMVFNKRMRVAPMYDIAIMENPVQSVPLCRVPRVDFGVNFSTTTMMHCPFLDTVRQEYLPILDSRLQDVRFNCFFPGKGPGNVAHNKISPSCTESGGCCGVGTTPNDSFCCNGMPWAADKESCLNNLLP